MKIKIFSGGKADSLEQQVNEFIKGKKIIDIKQSASSAIQGSSDSPYPNKVWKLTIMVMYEEDKQSVDEDRGIRSV